MKNTYIYCFITITLLLSNNVFSQNLIPNGDFEEFSECPIFGGQIDRLIHWFDPMELGSPEFFHTCAPFGSISIPKNSLGGYQFPQSGEGYIGLILYIEVLVF